MSTYAPDVILDLKKLWSLVNGTHPVQNPVQGAWRCLLKDLQDVQDLFSKVIAGQETITQHTSEMTQDTKLENGTRMNSNSGGSNPKQYALPPGASELQDLVEYRGMNFAIGNIFKACYRLGNCEHSTDIRDLEKILWFAQRELDRRSKKINSNSLS